MVSKKSLTALFLSLSFLTACPSLKKQEAAPPAAPAPASSAVAPAEAKPTAAPGAKFATPIDSTKGFYDAVVAEKYDIAWSALSKASQDKFIAMVAEDEKMDPAKVRELFEQNQTSIQLGFWKSFRSSSKLEAVAPKATYKVLNEGPELAEVELTSGDVTLKSKAIKENGQWKMGYVETFLPEK
ncbi:MAG: hypothetical protein U1F66_03440 [bacterium]